MKDVNIISTIVGRGTDKSIMGKAPSMGAFTAALSDYIPISGYTDVLGEKNFTGGLKVNGSPIYYDTEKKYWKLEGDLLVTGGVTMYGNDSDFVASTIAKGLPFDNRTIWFNPTTKQIEVIGGSGEGVSNFWDLSGIPSWITNTKPTYSYSEIKNTPDLSVYALKSDIPSLSGYATEQWVLGKGYALSSDLSKYIPIAGVTDITGEKNFVGGLKVNGSPIYYDTEKKYWKLEGDLLVTGGVTMYGNDSDFVASTIMGAILYDDTTLGINARGQLYVKGGTGDVSGDYLPLSGGVMTGWIGLPKGTAIYDGNTYTLFGLSPSGDDLLVGHNLHNLTIRSYDTTIQTRGDSLRHYNINTGVTSTILDSSNWSQYITAGDGGSYLPLSGGTINGSGDYLYVPLSINALNNQISGITFKTNGAERGHVGYSSGLGIRLHSSTTSGIAVSDSDVPIFYTADGSIKNTIWHSGNDGSGSGLDADLLDGVHAYISGNNGGVWGYIPSVKSDGVIELGRYIDFHFQSGENIDYATRLYVDAANKNNVALPSSSGTLALLTDNVASATKLQTARTIWGQSFDGTGDIGNKSGSDASSIHIVDNRNDGVGGYQAIRFYYNTDNQAAIHYFHNNFNGLAWTSKNLNIEADYITLGSWSNPTMIVHRNNGNVGIGTTSPSQKLHIEGNVYATGYVNPSDIRFESSNPQSAHSGGFRMGRFDEPLGGIKLQFGGDGTGNFSIINRAWSAAALTLNNSGNLSVSGGITMYSDQRKKTILNYVELSLQQVANAPLIEHYYNSDENKTTHVGSIAQYWAEMNDWFCKKDSEGYYTMEIQNAALASAISVARELVKFETETDRRIRLLEEENKRLKEEIEILKCNIA